MRVAARALPGAALITAGLRKAISSGLLRDPLSYRVVADRAIRGFGREALDDEFFRAGIERLAGALSREARLSVVGVGLFRQLVTTSLRNRVALERDRAAPMACPGESVGSPVVITGLPRTGTTFLFNLLAEDPRLRAPLGWELEELPDAIRRRDAAAVERARTRAGKGFDRLNFMVPGFRAIHEFAGDLPQECVAIFGQQFMSPQFITLFNVPSYQKWLEEVPAHPAYELHRRILAALPTDAGQRWLLKSPAHLPWIRELLEAYPDARLIQMHRDPASAIASFSSFSFALRTVGSLRVDAREVGAQQESLWRWAVVQSMAARSSPGVAERVLDVTHEDLQTDLIGTLARIYAHVGLSLEGDVTKRVEQYRRDNPRDKFGKHRYSPEEFGLDAPALRRRWSDYVETYRVKIPAAR